MGKKDKFETVQIVMPGHIN